ADDRVGAEVARLRIGDVHRAALAAAVPRLLAEQLGEHAVDRRALGQAMAVPAVRARDEVVAAQRLAHAHGHALLADIEVGEARHLRALVQLVHLLLEGANLRHLPIKVEVLLEVEPGFGGLGRHPHPPMGLRGVWSARVDPQFLPPPAPYTSMFLTSEMLRRFARDPENHLPKTFLEEALAKGDACYGIFDGTRLASYGWYSTKPSRIHPSH